jgi:hypothetical protein
MKRIAFGLVIVVTLVSGCSQVHKGTTMNGIHFEIEGGVAITKVEVNNDVKIDSGPFHVEMHDGKVFVNQTDRGPIGPGDTLKIDARGQVFVNGQRRDPPKP